MSPGHRRRPAAASGRAAAADRLVRADRSRTFPPLPGPEGTAATAAASWWGDAWWEALETGALDAARLARGRTYARDGHVDTINVTPGRVIATVRGSRPRPYSAEVRVRTFTEQEWDAFLDGAAAHPDRLTALLAKKLPRALAEGEVRLLPGPDELVPRCSCPDSGRPCKHAAALCFQVARLLDADPFVLLLIRGRGERELLDALARRNAGHDAREGRDARESHDAGEGRGRAGAPVTVPPGSGGAASGAAAGQTMTPASVPIMSTAAGPTSMSASPSPAPSASTSVAASAPHGVLAREALADRPRPSLPPPAPMPPRPGQPAALPDAGGLPFDVATLELLATDAAARAHAYLTAPGAAGDAAGPAGPAPFPTLPPEQDAIRLIATAHPTAGLTATTRALYRDLATATGRTPTDIARSVAAWRQGGPEGLALLDHTWNPPAGDFDRARSALLAAGQPALRPHHNHLTDAGRGIQLRFGRDSRWYPYESEPGITDWWPTGPADPDPVTALTTLLAR